MARLRRVVRSGGFDVVHVHEPVAPPVGWLIPQLDDAPLVGTFHTYSTRPVPHRIATAAGARLMLNRLAVRIAVSEAAAWTGRRWYGGRYLTIPNGVDVSAALPGDAPPGEDFVIAFVGRVVERKGLAVLLSAFGALVDVAPVRLVLVGPTADELSGFGLASRVAARIDALGRVDADERWRRLHAADVLCAPSLGGESFGMVLTEAFAAGTPVVASSIAGYSEVVTQGVDGLLVPPDDPVRLAEALRGLALDRERAGAMGAAARNAAARYAWPHVAERVRCAYEQAREVPAPSSAPERVARRFGLAPADGRPPAAPARLAPLDPPAARRASRTRTLTRRAGLAAACAGGAALTAFAVQKIGPARIVEALLSAHPGWVLVSLVLMSVAMLSRAAAWRVIVRAALPGRRVRARDVTSATMIGVLLSAVLPGRVGEPARVAVLARRLGAVARNVPLVTGTVVAQTALNLVALAALAVAVIATSPVLSSRALLVPSLGAAGTLAALVLAPALLPRAGRGRLTAALERLRHALIELRSGLRVLGSPRALAPALALQLAAWALQLASAYTVALALGVGAQIAVPAAAAALLAANVSAIVPVTPSNVGVFQAAVAGILIAGYGVTPSSALVFAIAFQAAEVVTAIVLGLPALLREGMRWPDARSGTVEQVRLSSPARSGATQTRAAVAPGS